MPSENYYNQGNGQAPSHPKYSSASFADLYPEQSSVAAIRQRRLERGMQAAKNSFDQIPRERQRELQNKLKQVRKVAPNLAKEAKQSFIKKKPSSGLIKSASSMFRQIDWLQDWLFIPFLASFALLKDLFDIAFAAIGAGTSWIPVVGEGAVAIGMIITFTGEIFLLILTVIVLVLTGSSLKNRGMAKYFISIAIAFMSEAFPGIGWLPLAFIEVFVLYGFVLFDRASEEAGERVNHREGEENSVSIPALATADNYNKRLAA